MLQDLHSILRAHSAQSTQVSAPVNQNSSGTIPLRGVSGPVGGSPDQERFLLHRRRPGQARWFIEIDDTTTEIVDNPSTPDAMLVYESWDSDSNDGPAHLRDQRALGS